MKRPFLHEVKKRKSDKHEGMGPSSEDSTPRENRIWQSTAITFYITTYQ